MKTIYHPGYRRLMGKLRAARQSDGLRLVDVANQVGRHRDWLHRVETSQIRLDLLQFVRLCRALNLSSPALLEELEESSDDDSFLAISRLRPDSKGLTLAEKPHIPLQVFHINLHPSLECKFSDYKGAGV